MGQIIVAVLSAAYSAGSILADSILVGSTWAGSEIGRNECHHLHLYLNIQVLQGATAINTINTIMLAAWLRG